MRFGGTGIDSGSLVHTQDFPYRLEAGTLNLPGIIGFSESLDFLEGVGAGSIHAREMELLERLRDGLSVLTGVELYCVQTLSNHIGLLTANVRGLDPSDAGAILAADFNIAVRTGVHCSPPCSPGLGTAPYGSVRFGIGPFNTSDDIDRTLEAMAEIARHARRTK